MSSELPPKSDFILLPSTPNSLEQDQELNQIFNIPDHLQDSFTPLDSQLQGILFRADALVSDSKAEGEKKMMTDKRIEMEVEFLELTSKFGVSPNPYDILSVGWYDSQGKNIQVHRERLLQTGRIDVTKMIDVFSIDKIGRADTISVAAD